MMSGNTDFERFALAGAYLEPRDRNLLLTIDFEAFNQVGPFELWLTALDRWSLHSMKNRWKSSIFLSLEDVAQLKHDRPDEYQAFLSRMRTVARSGAAIYPHNHGVFDSRTGRQATSRPQHVRNYGKRASFFYDVVHRHRLDLGEWMLQLLGQYDQFLEDAEVSRPERLAFRAGGWDHGATPDESALYINAVRDAGFAYDSSVTAGTFGTAGFRICAPFCSNTFALKPPLVEVAPCWSYDCGANPISHGSIASFRRLATQPQVWARPRRAGAFVVVLHFDHLFRSNDGDKRSVSLSMIDRRVERFFSLMSCLKGFLRLTEVITFEQLPFSEQQSNLS
jgi:hypothetical protein